jgi:acyl carrier protein
VLARLHQLAAESLSLTRPPRLDDELVGDLALDSVSLVVVAVGLENHFRVRLDEADAGPLRTVRDLVQLVARRIEEAR